MLHQLYLPHMALFLQVLEAEGFYDSESDMVGSMFTSCHGYVLMLLSQFDSEDCYECTIDLLRTGTVPASISVHTDVVDSKILATVL